jgi:threonine dehydrogenase-like Zn-dependent dehydrogenase
VVCEDVPMPSVADGEILVLTAYAPVCGSGLHVVFGGAPPRPRPGAAGCPGHQRAGEVVESAGHWPGL